MHHHSEKMSQDDDDLDDVPFSVRFSVRGGSLPERRSRDCETQAAPQSEQRSAVALPSPSPAPYRGVSSLHPTRAGYYSNGRAVRVRKWAFTSYDPEWTARGIPYSEATLPQSLEYICGKPEYNTTFDESGQQRKHFQGFAITADDCTAPELQRRLGISHAHGNPIGNVEVRVAINYTKKEESAVRDENGEMMWKEVGTVRNEMLRPAERHQKLKALITSGTATLEEIVTEDFKTALHAFGNLKQLRALFQKPQERDVEVYFIQGEPGTGKTWAVHHLLENEKTLYVKANKMAGATTDYWDGYDGQEAVLFDDIDEEAYGIYTLLQLLDRYPLRVNVKYGSGVAAWTRVYITSNRPLDKFFPRMERVSFGGEQGKTNHWHAFLRRIPEQNRCVCVAQPNEEEAAHISTFADFKSYQEAAAEDLQAQRDQRNKQKDPRLLAEARALELRLAAVLKDLNA